LRRRLKAHPFEITLDEAFESVIKECAQAPRPDQDGTWITNDMERCYLTLHEKGYAHSVEAWQDGELVGGLYGVAMGGIYFGESMFAKAPDASKIAFVMLVRQLAAWGFEMIDSQVYTDHLARFGAKHITRDEYLRTLRGSVTADGRRGRWSFD
jgi:leucyl/phenylalanyl-tRNA--protein transferase